MIIEIDGGWQTAKLETLLPDGELPSLDGMDFFPANVPQSLHYDLMAAGRLANVYGGRRNVIDAAWVSQSDWVYTAPFLMDGDALKADKAVLNIPCIDTFSDVFVNGEYLGSTDSMFVPWQFEIPAACRKPQNKLVIHVKGHGRMVADKADENVRRIGCPGAESWSRERTLVRRYQRSYNTDFFGGGVALQGIGLMRPVYLESYNLPSIRRVDFATLDASGQKASVLINVVTEGAKDGETVSGVLSLDGKTALEFEGEAKNGAARIRAELPKPEFWHPRGEGKQTLYDLTVSLGESNVSSRVGIRTVKLVQEQRNGRKDFQFIVNGKPINIRGANWVPPDLLNAGVPRGKCEILLKLCANANMNMLRLWGGGMEEPDWFYGLCDELGILVWQDAHMHSHTYPDYDDAFVAKVTAESAGMITRLRSHPCFAVFCGGNEQEEGWDTWNWTVWHDRFYGERILYEALPLVAAEYCPEIPYIPNSPFGEKNCQSPVDGDTHTWGNFYNATEDPLFVTETCWHDGTISRPETLETLMGINADDFQGLRWNARFAERTGHILVSKNQYTEYHLLGSLRDYARGLEIEQLRADYTALFMLRTMSPSCRGILYWPLNKGGPMMNYGSVDYGLRPLMPYYGMVRLFRDAVIHAVREAGDITVCAANDKEPFEAVLTTELRTVDGKVIASEMKRVALPKSNSVKLTRLEGWYGQVINRWREYVYVSLTSPDGALIAEDAVYFCPFAEVEAEDAGLEAAVKPVAGGAWEITLSAKAFSKLVMLEIDANAMFTDNYFLLSPGVERAIRFEPLGEAKPSRITVRAIDRDETITLGL